MLSFLYASLLPSRHFFISSFLPASFLPFLIFPFLLLLYHTTISFIPFFLSSHFYICVLPPFFIKLTDHYSLPLLFLHPLPFAFSNPTLPLPAHFPPSPFVSRNQSIIIFFLRSGPGNFGAKSETIYQTLTPGAASRGGGEFFYFTFLIESLCGYPHTDLD